MGSLYLVRHGQASLGAADYDQLSDLGQRQCRRLGHYFAERGFRFEAVYTGTLVRHRQSLAAISEALPQLPPAQEWPGLNEYDSSAVIRAVHAGPLPRPQTPEAMRQHFRLLRIGLLDWMDGRSQPAQLPPYKEFRAGVVAALEHALPHHRGHVLVLSSGGPISAAVGHLLQLQPAAIVDLNMRLRNSALCELIATEARHMLLTWNTLPHLDHPDCAGWATFA